MKFTFITLFPEIIYSYFNSGVLSRALNSKINVECVNIRDFAPKFRVDNKLIGGGAGMLLDPHILHSAIHYAKEKYKLEREEKEKINLFLQRTIFLSPSGAKFSKLDSKRLSSFKHIILVCGRYQGFDERSVEISANEIFSIGDFILSGGELSALCMADSISRFIEKVIGDSKSLEKESFDLNLLEAPNFTNTHQNSDIFTKSTVPLELLKGNHSKIDRLKLKMSEMKTKYFRPDLYINKENK